MINPLLVPQGFRRGPMRWPAGRSLQVKSGGGIHEILRPESENAKKPIIHPADILFYYGNTLGTAFDNDRYNAQLFIIHIPIDIGKTKHFNYFQINCYL